MNYKKLASYSCDIWIIYCNVLYKMVLDRDGPRWGPKGARAPSGPKKKKKIVGKIFKKRKRKRKNVFPPPPPIL